MPLFIFLRFLQILLEEQSELELHVTVPLTVL